jgi:hypothetical protein
LIQPTYEIAMENWFKFSFKTVFFLAFLLLIALNVVVAYSENAVFLNSYNPILIPFFLIFYFVKNKVLSLAFVLFLIFSFFGDTIGLFLGNNSVDNASNMMYLLSYFCLIFIGIHKFKFNDIDKIIGTYLLAILLINAYFLFTICDIINSLISDKLEMILFGGKSMALVFLVFVSFAVYLGKQTKASILFLIMAICFAFSDMLNYITHYYIYNWSILMLDRLMHVIGLLFAFVYVIESNKITKEKYVEKPELQQGTFSGDNILV